MIAPPNVLRAARELVGVKQVDAAAAAGISRRSIQRLEAGERDWANASVLLQTYYESRGIVFLRPTDGNGWGLIDNKNLKVLPHTVENASLAPHIGSE